MCIRDRNQLSLQQKVIIGGSAVLTTILLIVLLTFLNEPTFSPLYSDMTSDDASKVIEFLTAQKIQYKIEAVSYTHLTLPTSDLV